MANRDMLLRIVLTLIPAALIYALVRLDDGDAECCECCACGCCAADASF